MQFLPDYFYHVNILSVTFRLLLAVIVGGIIGLERGATKHPAGFRTHILVCVGAALAMLTNQYIYETMTNIADPSRMGAQVITGVGFLGVGTILVTGGQKIKGLTTAAGLWASACLGLALGIGFYSGALIGGILIFAALTFFKRLENHFYEHSHLLDLYVELESLSELKKYKTFIHDQEILIQSSHRDKTGPSVSGGIGFHMSIKFPRGMKRDQVLELLSNHEGIYLIEEM